MAKEWHAGEIIKRLTKLHPRFYPIPTDQVLDASGAVISTVPISKDHLKKESLMRLYNECGEILHRGNLNDIMSPTLRHLDLAKVARWATDITHLLNHHQIPLIDQRTQIWVLMNANDGGDVQWSVMEKRGGPGPTTKEPH